MFAAVPLRAFLAGEQSLIIMKVLLRAALVAFTCLVATCVGYISRTSNSVLEASSTHVSRQPKVEAG